MEGWTVGGWVGRRSSVSKGRQKHCYAPHAVEVSTAKITKLSSSDEVSSGLIKESI